MKKSKKTKQLKKRKQKVRYRKYSPNQIKKKLEIEEEREIKEEGVISNKVWFILILASIVFMYFMPEQIAYAEYGVVILLVLMFAVLPYSISKIMKSFYGEGGITTLCVMLLSLFFGGTAVFYQIYKEEKELEIQGIATKCFVIDRSRSRGRNHVTCNYFVDGVEFIANTNEGKIEYKIGDTLELIYNKKFPRSHRINIE